MPGDAEGLTAAAPERKMGMKGSPTAQLHFDGVRVPDARRLGLVRADRILVDGDRPFAIIQLAGR